MKKTELRFCHPDLGSRRLDPDSGLPVWPSVSRSCVHAVYRITSSPTLRPCVAFGPEEWMSVFQARHRVLRKATYLARIWGSFWGVSVNDSFPSALVSLPPLSFPHRHQTNNPFSCMTQRDYYMQCTKVN